MTSSNHSPWYLQTPGPTEEDDPPISTDDHLVFLDVLMSDTPPAKGDLHITDHGLIFIAPGNAAMAAPSIVSSGFGSITFTYIKTRHPDWGHWQTIIALAGIAILFLGPMAVWGKARAKRGLRDLRRRLRNEPLESVVKESSSSHHWPPSQIKSLRFAKKHVDLILDLPKPKFLELSKPKRVRFRGLTREQTSAIGVFAANRKWPVEGKPGNPPFLG